MDARYQKWIEEYVAPVRRTWADGTTMTDGEAVRGFCASASRAMVVTFPELRQARGYYRPRGLLAGAEHWWCVAPDGTVVDPTAAQFPPGGIYEEFDPAKHGPEPIGKCYECGEYVYTREHGGLCSETCHNAFTRDLNEARWG